MILVCFDVGGTSVKYALINNGTIIEKSSFVSKNDVEYLLDEMVKIVNKYQKIYSIQGVGLSMPGAVSSTGVIYGYSALPNIHGPNWIELLESRINLPVYIENDANCAALAEIEYGSGSDNQDAIFLVIGSGVGGAIVKNRQIHHGANLSGGEFGYMVMNCNEAKPRTFSNLASTVSLVNKVRGIKNDFSLTGEEVFDLAKNGDEISRKCVDEFYLNLAVGIFNIQYAFDPEIILLSGAVSKQEDFLNQITAKINLIKAQVDGADIFPKLALCTAGADANMIGAYANFKNNHQKNKNLK